MHILLTKYFSEYCWEDMLMAKKGRSNLTSLSLREDGSPAESLSEKRG